MKFVLFFLLGYATGVGSIYLWTRFMIKRLEDMD